MRFHGRWSVCQRPRLQPEKQRNAGPARHVVPSVIEVGTRFAQRRDRESRSLQRSRVGFEGLRPTGEMHPQAIAFVHAFETVPAEISAFEKKGAFASMLAKRPRSASGCTYDDQYFFVPNLIDYELLINERPSNCQIVIVF